MKSDQCWEFQVLLLACGGRVINLPPKRERLISLSQRQAFSGESTALSLIMDSSNASIFSSWGIFNSAAYGPWLFAKKFYFGACEEIGVNVQ